MIGEWVYRLCELFYRPKDSKFSRCDIVVPIDYGILFQKKLPDAGKKTIREAVRIASDHQVLIVWASANFFWPGCQQEEDALRIEEAKIAGLTANPIISRKGTTNTITEAENIREAIIEASIELRSKIIVVVANWPHARSVRKIYKRIFPESTIAVRSINGQWNESHPAFFGRSELRWLLINIFRHLALILFGIRIVRLAKQPIIKGDA